MNDRRDRDTERELRFHLEQHTAELIQKGLPRPEAERQARLALGGLVQVQEECRDVRPGRWLEQLLAQLRYALRAMRQSPVQTLAVILTVAICVAVNTAVFTVVDSLLLRPLPFFRADRLVLLTNEYPKAGVTETGFSSSGDYFDRQAAVTALAEHALITREFMPIDRQGIPVQVRGLAVTPSFFPLLRLRPAEGRLFNAGDGLPGKNFSIILTHELRRDLFGARPVLGETVRLGGIDLRIVGVLPPGFRYQSSEIRFLLPLALGSDARQSHHSNRFEYLARLRDGATLAQAQSQVDALNASLVPHSEFKDLLVSAGFHTRVRELQPWLVRQARPSLQFLWAGASVVLLIGIVNIAGLALARATYRLRETATRLALGASRGQLLLQQLCESALPAAIGGAAGLGLGAAALRSLDPEVLPSAVEIGVAPSVFAYALLGAAAVALLATLASLLPARRLTLARAISDGGRGGSSRHKTTLRRVLVAAQVGLAFVLLYSAGVLTASLRELARVDPGFRIDRVGTAVTILPEALYQRRADIERVSERILEQVRALPGVETAGLGNALPFQEGYADNVLLPEGYTARPGETAVSPTLIAISAGYLETLGLRPLAGRLFEEAEDPRSPGVLIDDKLARRLWPGQSPIGRRAYRPGDDGPRQMLTVRGVLPTVRLQDLALSGRPIGVYYVPWSQNPTHYLALAWRAQPGAERAVAEAVRRGFPQWAPGAALMEMRSLTERRDRTLLTRRLAQSLALVFAAVAAALAAIGIYGLFAFLLSQRKREIGIRMAMGCRPTRIIDLFLRDGLSLSLAGLAAGFALVLGLKSWIAAQLYGVGAVDPLVLALVAAALLLLAAAAIAAPAWRASRIDPAHVLRDS